MEFEKNNGWIPIPRSLFYSEFWRELTPEQAKITITLIAMASYKEHDWIFKGEGYTVKPGQFITSLDKIQKMTGKQISIKNIRTCLNILEKVKFLANESTKHGRLITLLNWDTYQINAEPNGKPNGKQVANNGQTDGKQVANQTASINKGINNGNDIKNGETGHTQEPESEFFQSNFNKFWFLYQKDKDKEKAFKLWCNLSKEDISAILIHVPEYVKSTPEVIWRKDPYNYLYDKSWNNEIIYRPEKEKSFYEKRATLTMDEIDRSINNIHNSANVSFGVGADYSKYKPRRAKATSVTDMLENLLKLKDSGALDVIGDMERGLY